MLQLKRPRKPRGFEAAVRSAREAVEAAVACGNEPVFEPVWRRYKAEFAQAQHHKCGYCEIKAFAGEPGDVEHYHPKAAVWALRDDPSTWGREVPHLSNVEGRRHRVLSSRGYWWLAYEWKNYLLACDRCNSAWKASFFPVEEASRALPPDPRRPEMPLLLSPFGRRKPGRHLRFSDLGQVESVPSSPFGFETIRTCGLDRESLRDAREEKARKTYDLLQRLSSADGAKAKEHMRDLVELGRVDYAHAGMVRAIFEDVVGTRWRLLEDAVGSAGP